MVQYIQQGDIFGRLGSGFGQGLSEQLPKEIERTRLASGLKKLGEQKELSPFEQFSGLASLPGVTPQMIQSGSDLLRQQGISEGFRKVREGQNSSPELDRYRPKIENNFSKDVATVEPTQAAINPELPKTRQQLLSRAAELKDENPQLYPTADLAFQGALDENNQDIALSNALQNQRSSQIGVQTNIRNQLKDLQSAANAKVPDNVYRKIEDKALEKVKKGELSELDAALEGREELDQIARDYNQIKSLGDYTFIMQNPKEVLKTYHSLKKKFKENNDLENFADYMVAHNGLPNEFAYSKAFERRPEISNFVKNLQDLSRKTTVVPGTGGLIQSRGTSRDKVIEKTEELVPKLAKLLKKEDSPLAIAQDLKDKGYDDLLWKKYLIDHQEELDLSQRQVRELEKVDKGTQGFLNETFLKIFGGW